MRESGAGGRLRAGVFLSAPRGEASPRTERDESVQDERVSWPWNDRHSFAFAHFLFTHHTFIGPPTFAAVAGRRQWRRSNTNSTNAHPVPTLATMITATTIGRSATHVGAAASSFARATASLVASLTLSAAEMVVGGAIDRMGT